MTAGGDIVTTVTMTSRELSDLLYKAHHDGAVAGAIETRNEFMKMFGVNMADLKSIEDFKKDLLFNRTLREGSHAAGVRVMMIILTMTTMAAVATLGIAFWEYIIKRLAIIH